MTVHQGRAEFSGAEGNVLVGSAYGAAEIRKGPPVLLVHGGGQTRHAWGGTARALGEASFLTLSIDQRGHGESDWVRSGAYTFFDYAADLQALCSAIALRHGAKPVLVGASLGGIAGLLAQDMTPDGLLSGLVLVDITPRMDPDGIARIQGFMGERLHEGFATLEDAADAIAAYLPYRSRPRSMDGLAKNLRLGADGRYRWHWDPAFIDGPQAVNTGTDGLQERLFDACRRLAVPTLLVRGRQSELVTEDAAAEFRALVPHAAYADVSGAGHMVAGDRNDAFTAAVVAFLKEAAGPSSGR